LFTSFQELLFGVPQNKDKESVKLIKQTENEQSFAMETDYTWTFSNECMKYAMTFQKTESQGMKIRIIGTNAKRNCNYSLKKAKGYILLEPDKEDIKITYYFHSESLQNIPLWLINSMIYKMPFQTFIA
jgi:N6-adenosine-specific RNA methylase IME4